MGEMADWVEEEYLPIRREETKRPLLEVIYREREKVKKLEGWLKYLYNHSQGKISIDGDREKEIKDYIKAMEAR
jgi:hypothetical protein